MSVTFVERVKRGVKLLDKKFPKWYNKIKVNTFDLKCGSSCILGQVFGNYIAGLNQLNIGFDQDEEGDPHIESGVPYGFWLPPDSYTSEGWHKGVEKLTSLWKSVVQKKKQKKKLVKVA